jgi:hypothetical protein
LNKKELKPKQSNKEWDKVLALAQIIKELDQEDLTLEVVNMMVMIVKEKEVLILMEVEVEAYMEEAQLVIHIQEVVVEVI